MHRWFPCLGDVPGVTWVDPHQIALDRVAEGRRTRPRVEKLTGYDGPDEFIVWPQPGGGEGSASPAKLHADRLTERQSTGYVIGDPRTVIQAITEVCALPGEPRDYYYALATAVELLRRFAISNPALYDDVERLSRIQLALIASRPDTVVQDEYGDTTPVRNPTTDQLVDDYAREGAFSDAHAAATVMTRLGTVDDRPGQYATSIEASAPPRPPDPASAPPPPSGRPLAGPPPSVHTEIDAYLVNATRYALAGNPIVTLQPSGTRAPDHLIVPAPPDWITEPARPDARRIRWGICNTAAIATVQPRLLHTAIHRQTSRVVEDRAALVVDDLLVPWFKTLYQPALFTRLTTTTDLEQLHDVWSTIGLPTGLINEAAAGHVDLGMIAEGRRRFLDQLTARLAATDLADVVSRWRRLQIQPLIVAHAAPKRRPPRRRTVLKNKKLRQTHATWYANDWDAFLAHLNAPAHPDDSHGSPPPPPAVNVEDINEVVTRREALMDWWAHFDAVHANLDADAVDQLRGLGHAATPVLDLPHSRLQALWPSDNPGGHHRTIADILKPAAGLFNDIALTCWFLWNGPYARSTAAALRHRHAAELDDLANYGTPVAQALFDELAAVEAAAPTPYRSMNEPMGISISLDGPLDRTPTQTNLAGMEQLLDAVTTYRRRWAADHLQAFITRRAVTDLEKAAQGYHQATVERSGKPPTASQASRWSEEPAVRWFGGDITKLHAALGQTLT